MRRSTKAEQLRRLNSALEAVQAQGSVGQVRRKLMRSYGMSRRQAYRYARRARQVQRLLPLEDYG